MDFITSAQFRASPEDGKAVHKGYNVEVKGVDDKARTVTFVASTEAVDRYGDSIKLDGWRLDRFKANPVILFGHDSHALPIGKAVDIGVKGDALVVKIQFASAEANPAAENVFRLIEEGCLNAVSVGFMCLRWQLVDDQESGRWGYDILEAELLEISVVPIPAHPDALIQASFKGLDVSPFTGGGSATASKTAPIKAEVQAENTPESSAIPSQAEDNSVQKQAEIANNSGENNGISQEGEPSPSGTSYRRAEASLQFLKLKGAA